MNMLIFWSHGTSEVPNWISMFFGCLVCWITNFRAKKFWTIFVQIFLTEIGNSTNQTSKKFTFHGTILFLPNETWKPRLDGPLKKKNDNLLVITTVLWLNLNFSKKKWNLIGSIRHLRLGFDTFWVKMLKNVFLQNAPPGMGVDGTQLNVVSVTAWWLIN